EALAVTTAAKGAGHWQTIDARWALKDCEAKSKMTLWQRGRLRQAVAWSHKAERLFHDPQAKQALPLARAALGSLRCKDLSSLSRLVERRQKAELEAAIRLVRMATEIIQEVMGEKHPLHAGSLNDLARLHLAAGDHKAAMPLFEKAAAIRKEVLGEKHPDYAASLDDQADALR